VTIERELVRGARQALADHELFGAEQSDAGVVGVVDVRQVDHEASVRVSPALRKSRSFFDTERPVHTAVPRAARGELTHRSLESEGVGSAMTLFSDEGSGLHPSLRRFHVRTSP
jgi:hypothetical protein